MTVPMITPAGRITTRPRGYAPWSPRPKTLALLGNVRDVLVDYGLYLPVTARQVHYRLVAVHRYPKTEAAYAQLTEKVNRARRAGLIDWDAIRDDRPTIEEPFGYADMAEFLRFAADGLSPFHYRRHPREGQERDIWIACEASGMVPQIANATRSLGVTVVSSGGFDSTTLKRRIAKASTDKPLIVLHVGDHDPSGVHLYQSFAEDVTAFAKVDGGSVTFERVAVTPEQIERFDLETAPPKVTDRRAFVGETVQAEALPPDVLIGLITDAVNRHTDPDIAAALLDTEAAEREHLTELLAPVLALLDKTTE